MPAAVTGGLEDALVRGLALEERRRALRVAATGLLLELADLAEGPPPGTA